MCQSVATMALKHTRQAIFGRMTHTDIQLPTNQRVHEHVGWGSIYNSRPLPSPNRPIRQLTRPSPLCINKPCHTSVQQPQRQLSWPSCYSELWVPSKARSWYRERMPSFPYFQGKQIINQQSSELQLCHTDVLLRLKIKHVETATQAA